MKTQFLLLLLSGIATLSIGCDGGECAVAFDKELECRDMSDSRREKMKKFRDETISACNKTKDEPEVKTALKCGKVNSCEEYKSCTLAASSERDIEEIETALKNGDPGEAMNNCKYSLDTFTTVPTFKTVCEKAFTAGFAKLDDEDIYRDLKYLCANKKDYPKWKAASTAINKGCESILATLKAKIVKQRDASTEYQYSDCSYYKDLTKIIAPKETTTELLCNEAQISDDFAEGFAEVKKNIADAKAKIPHRCSSILESEKNTKELADSEWFKGKSKELATACYGEELAILVLQDVSSHCLTDGKTTRKMIAKYNLAAGNAELTALVEKTAAECMK